LAAGKKGSQQVERAVSAGGVVFRRSDAAVEVVICGRDSDGVWGLPKGTPDPGESLEQTAIREVTEETGLQVRIIDKVGVVEYWFSRDGVRYHKWVHHYLLECLGGNTEDHDLEYDRVEWRPIGGAIKTLSFKNEVDIVVKARQMIEARR
jgi:8-oxo-dGTP pyrophosphatase MutT (NUDIX family)